jgi:HD-GYP domain-containing protein (c-di-GMP phosphodiesterase class II)
MGAVRRVKVSVSELRRGMYVCELDRPWLESPFAFQGFPLRTDADIQAVREVCDFVYVDPERSTPAAAAPRRPTGSGSLLATVYRRRPGKDAAPAAPPARAGPTSWFRRAFFLLKPPPRLPADIVHSLETAGRSFDATRHLVGRVLEEVRWGESVDLPAAREAVGSCLEHITRNPDAMLLLGSIRAKDEYTAQHSMNVSILAMVLGHRLGLPRAKLKELGLAAMLHDLGKVRTPLSILNKPARLTPEELRIVWLHPQHGREILLGCEGIGRAVLDVVHDHHERLDGSGYPRGLADMDIGLFTRIVSIADTYDAITSERVYLRGRTSIEALKVLRSAGNQYDAHLISEFVEAIGLFPAGSVVQLNNGCCGIVVRTNMKYEFRPSVLVLKDGRQQDVRPYYVDLADVAGRGGTECQIARMLHADECGIDLTVLKDREFLAGVVE